MSPPDIIPKFRKCVMRKYLLILFSLLFCGAAAFADSVDKAQRAQADSLKSALKEARRFATDKTSPNYDKARTAMKKAFVNPLGKENADVLLLAGQIEYWCFQTERNKPASGKKTDEKVIYLSTADGYSYLDQAYDLFLAEENSHPSKKVISQIQQQAYELYRATQGFRATAGFYYKQKDWKKAHHFFSLALHCLDCRLLTDYAASNAAMKADFATFGTDSIRTQLLYSCAVTAVMMEDHRQAIADLEAVKNRGFETNKIYQQLSKEYLVEGDSANYISTLKQGMVVVPDEPWYCQNLLNFYIERQQMDSALVVVEQLIRTTPGNAVNVEMKGRILEETGNILGAEQAYKTAVSMDSTLLISNMNLGRIYFNRAIAREDAYIAARRYSEIYNDIVPLYEEALPYYWKAYENDTARSNATIAEVIRTILFKRFQNPRCKNYKELLKKYNDVSRAYGLDEL